MERPASEVGQIFEDPTSLCFFSVGTKGSSKTFTCMAFVYDSLKKKRFDEYYLYLPSFSIEQKKSYHWLTKFKEVTIVEKYSSEVSDYVISRCGPKHPRAKDPELREEKRRVFYFLDDITAVGHDATTNDESLRKIITEARHVNCVLWINAHSLKHIISPAVRANMDRLMIMRITEKKLLESIYEAYFSTSELFPAFKDFLAFFRERVLKVKYNGLCMDTLEGTFCNTLDLDIVKQFVKDIDRKVPALQPGDLKDMRRRLVKDGMEISDPSGHLGRPAPGQPLIIENGPKPGTKGVPLLRKNTDLVKDYKSGQINHYHYQGSIVERIIARAYANPSNDRQARGMRQFADRMLDRVDDDSDGGE